MESRRALTETGGYELAFGTRSAAPRTWFHFGRDTLYLRPNTFAYVHGWYRLPPVEITACLAGSWWDVG